MARRSPCFTGRSPSSARATAAARGSSRKSDTSCEVALRRRLWALGLRYRKNVAGLPGKPDVAFPWARVAVFCDGDFWHGREWEERRARLLRGHNSDYWLQKIERIIVRDQAVTAKLKAAGWVVLRFWEEDIQKDVDRVAARVAETVRSRCPPLRVLPDEPGQLRG